MKKIVRYFLHDFLFNVVMGITAILPNNYISTNIRGFLVKHFFKKCGKKFKIASGVKALRVDNITIGDDVYIAHNVWINGVGKLQLSDNVIISPNCVIDTSRHIYENGQITNKSHSESIHIGKGTWVAANSTVIHGVKIGEGCIIAANTCVTKDVESHKMVGGVPAKIIKELK
ncbi:acyltransferase [Candidatus Saccharibacteria bacterium]|nr:acyltransferase [Candidatus Saccharibacteria bacterium]